MTSDDGKPQNAETELKFDVTPADLKKLARHPALAGPGEVRKLKSVYFDTPDFALRKQGISLRVRTVDGQHIQTVKRVRDANIFEREEWETDIASADLDLAVLAGTPAAKALKKADGAATPMFAAKVTRTKRTWTNGETTIEIVVDRGDISAGGEKDAICEMELELKRGDPRRLHDLARDLVDLAPLRLSLTTKGERGYQLVDTSAGAGKFTSAPLRPDMTIAEAFASVARSCLIQIAGAADILRRRRTAESIHQTRIGLRRLRTAMRIFRNAVTDGAYAAINAETNWMADELADARNLDVFLEDAFRPSAAHLGGSDIAARYAEHLEKARLAAYDRAGEAASSPRFAKLCLDIALWVEDGAWKSDENALLANPIGPFAIDALDGLRKTVRDRGEDLEHLGIDERHKLRIRAKRLRYATEFFGRAFGDDGEKRRRKFSAALKSMQGSLGRLNDIATADQSALHALRGSRSTALTFVAGELVGRIKVREPRILAEASEAYQDFADAKRFWPRGKLDETAPEA